MVAIFYIEIRDATILDNFLKKIKTKSFFKTRIVLSFLDNLSEDSYMKKKSVL